MLKDRNKSQTQKPWTANPLIFAWTYKPVIWFALPPIPQPGVNAAAWVAQSPLVTCDMRISSANTSLANKL